MTFFKTSVSDFCVDTLFLNEHAQVQNKTKLKNETILKKKLV